LAKVWAFALDEHTTPFTRQITRTSSSFTPAADALAFNKLRRLESMLFFSLFVSYGNIRSTELAVAMIIAVKK
jgi:hypothetical protein